MAKKVKKIPGSGVKKAKPKPKVTVVSKKKSPQSPILFAPTVPVNLSTPDVPKPSNVFGEVSEMEVSEIVVNPCSIRVAYLELLHNLPANAPVGMLQVFRAELGGTTKYTVVVKTRDNYDPSSPFWHESWQVCSSRSIAKEICTKTADFFFEKFPWGTSTVLINEQDGVESKTPSQMTAHPKSQATTATYVNPAPTLPPPCPICTKPMQERFGTYGMFWGCSQFPKCHGLRNKDGKPNKQTLEILAKMGKQVDEYTNQTQEEIEKKKWQKEQEKLKKKTLKKQAETIAKLELE